MKPKQIPDQPKKALRIDEAARMLGVSHWTIRRLLRRGLLRSCRVLRTHLIPAEEIDRLLRDGQTEDR